MAIKNIIVRGKSQTTVMSAGLLSIKCDKATANNAYKVVSFESTTKPNLLTMSSSYFEDIYSEALNKVIKDLSNNAVYSINGIKPTEDGAFFITGSMCTDWKIVNGAITITDHCTPCFSCDAVFRIKREFEFYRILLNALKDINIYDLDTVVARIAYLEDERINVPEACRQLLADISQERLLDDIDINRYKLWFGDMLRQYVTTVHMWNYAVTFNNSSAIISNTPEDPSGIMIQTKRGIASCTGASDNDNDGDDTGTTGKDKSTTVNSTDTPVNGKPTTVKCNIDLSCTGAPGMSMFIPPPVTMFYPENFGTIDKNLATVTKGYETRKIEADFGVITKPGTVSLTLKALPFMGYVLKNGKGQKLFISSRDLDALIVDPGNGSRDANATGKFTETYEQLKVTAEQVKFDDPTLQQYYESKSYPSQSADRISDTPTLTWNITIKWTVTQDDVEKVEMENYIFETPGLRSNVVNFFRASDFTVIEGEDE